MVPHRADTTAVIGSALLASARGTGYRRTAGSSHMAAAARRQRVIPTPADGMLQRGRGLAVEKRQAPVVQHFDGAIDVAIMIGELQQHPVHLEPRTVVAMLFVGCRDVRGVLRHGPLVERRNEVREREAGPAWDSTRNRTSQRASAIRSGWPSRQERAYSLAARCPAAPITPDESSACSRIFRSRVTARSSAGRARSASPVSSRLASMSSTARRHRQPGRTVGNR